MVVLKIDARGAVIGGVAGAAQRVWIVRSGASGEALRDAAGKTPVRLLAGISELATARLVFRAGLERVEETRLLERCRALKAPINTIMRSEFRDIHMPAIVRHDDLNERPRSRLEELFGTKWGTRSRIRGHA